MNYRVLLVDDEMVDLEWLKRRVPWGELNLEVAATANSGFAALRILKEQHIDVLISDIRMPIMSGLELAQKAREIVPNLKVAFISGHEDFAYARQAIILSAIGYVLKPVKDDELMELLKTIKNALDKEKEGASDQNRLKDTINLLKDDIIHQWLEGSSNIDYSLLSHYGILSGNTKGPVVILEIDDVHWKLNNYEEKQRNEILAKCTEIIVDYINYQHLGYYYLNDSSHLTLITNEFEPTVLNYMLGKLAEKVKSNSPLTITIGLGEPCSDIGRLPESYGQARAALEYKMFLGKGRIIPYHKVENSEFQSPENIEDKIKSLAGCVMDYDLLKINNLIEDLFAKGLNTRKAVYNFTVHLISRLNFEFHKDASAIKELSVGELKDIDFIHNFETIDDIKNWLIKRLSDLSEQMAVNNEKKDRKIIEDIKKYVLDNVEDKLTLKEVADYFNFSPNYLGHMFKEATGENFSDFLIRMRMERACQYLLDHKMKIYEICDKIGYKNILYFNRQFKEFYGITPTEYRKRNKV